MSETLTATASRPSSPDPVVPTAIPAARSDLIPDLPDAPHPTWRAGVCPRRDPPFEKERDQMPPQVARRSTGAARRPTARVVSRTTDAPRYEKVYLRIHRVECVKTTKEIDRDEITVGVIKTVGVITEKRGRKLVRAAGKAGKSVNAGKFKKGTTRRFRPAKVVASFPYGGRNRDWPRHYPASIVLIERDKGSVSKVINTAINAIDEEAVTLATGLATTAATGLATSVAAGAAAGSVVPLVGTAVGAGVGAAVTVGLNAIKRSRAHDVIGFKRADCNLRRAPSKGGQVGDRKTLVFVGQKGRYKVTYSWEVR